MNPFRPDFCLICNGSILSDIGWRAIFSIEKEQYICTTCAGKLEKIEGDTCRICSRPFRLVADKFRDKDLCHDCHRWEESPEWKNLLAKNNSLFLYNDFLKEVIAKFKYRGDYLLAKVFAQAFKEKLTPMAVDMFVPIPLSKERQYERGFNQATALLEESGFTPTDILTRIHSEKQSKKSRSERIHLAQVFKVDTGIQLEGKRLVLIDDIYTTGSTLRHAAKLLKKAGAASIQSITLAR
jgi:competence protein ComFC